MDAVVGDNLSRAELRDLVGQLLARVACLEQYAEDTRRELARTQQELQEARAEKERLRRELDRVRRQLAASRKNSSTSSKPPSSDIVKPPPRTKGRKKSKRRPGGQPGHLKHERPRFDPDAIFQHTLDACPHCHGTDLFPAPEKTRVIQQVELKAVPVTTEEHRGMAYLCMCCGKICYAPLPPPIKAGGLLGPRLTALVAFLKGACHASFSTIRRYFRDVLKIPLSRGYLCKLIGKVSGSLEPAYAHLQHLLPEQQRLNVDETGHPNAGQRFWTWCFRAKDFVLFKVSGSRGSAVLWEMLGSDFAGVLGCDYFSAYRKYMKDCDIRVQFCLAHLIRELKYMATLPDAATVAYAESLLLAISDMFELIHRRHKMSQRAFEQAMRQWRDTVLATATYEVPDTREAQNMAARFRQHGAAYFEFITTPDVPPTNNLAEQAIRFVVIDRHVTQGTRSEAGRQWCERIWTVLATCAEQGRSAFEFLCSTVQAFFSNQPPPSLVDNTS